MQVILAALAQVRNNSAAVSPHIVVYSIEDMPKFDRDEGPLVLVYAVLLEA